MEKRARSWTSVSRIRAVMSWGLSRAVVNIRGGGKLQGSVSTAYILSSIQAMAGDTHGSSAMAAEEREICSRWFSRRDMAAIGCMEQMCNFIFVRLSRPTLAYCSSRSFREDEGKESK